MDMASSSSTMDPKKWGKLQQYVDLENVYLRLPLCRFFQLRGVCKAWNTLAQQRRCFTERVQKPYFVIVYPVSFREFGILHLAGILTLQIASGQWRWKRLPWHCSERVGRDILPPDFVPFSVKGLIYFSMSDWLQTIFDTHSGKGYDVMRFFEVSEGPRVVAMAVDTSATPYKVQPIIGGLNIDTSIHTCSGKSSVKKIYPSRIPAITRQSWPTTCMKSCVQKDDCVYTWWQTTTIQVYSLKEDKWMALIPPKNDGVGGILGCWDNRLFVVMEDGKLSVCVWELVDESRQAWRPFAHIPSELYSWLLAPAQEDPILASFCDQYVLIYTLLRRNDDREGMRDHFVLLDLATKQWEKGSLCDSPQSS